MTMTIQNPNNPATKSQLWYLHILTGENTSDWKLTVLEASAKIESLKSGNPNKNKPTNKRPIKNKAVASKFVNCTGYGLDIGQLQIMQAYKEISKQGDDSICIELRAVAIFPKGRKQHILYEGYTVNDGKDVYVQPLYGYANGVNIPIEDWRNWIKNLPIKINRISPIKPEWESKAIELAKPVNRTIAIIKVV